MKPYYQDSAVTIYNADNREVLPLLDKFDIVLTDPPYGLNKKIHDGGTWATAKKYDATLDWDFKIEKSDIDKIIKLSKYQIIWGGNYYTDILPVTRCWLVWVKPHFPTMSEVDLAWTNFDRPAKVYHCPRVNPSTHPTEKPLRLMKWVLQNYTEQKNNILDPFMGSGTTLRAAKDLNMKATGIEISEKYCEIAANRMCQEVLELKP